MLDHAVYEQEAVALGLGVEGEVLVFEALAVEADEVPCLAEDGGNYIGVKCGIMDQFALPKTEANWSMIPHFTPI